MVPGAVNLTQPVRYPVNISMMLFNDLFIYFAVVVFSHFFTSKELIRDSQSCNSVILYKDCKRKLKIILTPLKIILTPLRFLELLFDV